MLAFEAGLFSKEMDYLVFKIDRLYLDFRSTALLLYSLLCSFISKRGGVTEI
jgi:hypothetical protein